MKAIARDRYGSPDVLEPRELDMPVPADSELLIKVHAASVNAWDWRFLRADPVAVRFMEGLIKPKHQVLGADVAGVVEAVGSAVTQFKPGDRVYGDLGDCGGGSFAEYVCAPEHSVAPMPANASFEEAAATPMAATAALRGLRDVGKLQPGQQVLIHGASGGVGSFAVQIAKALGAEVTAVCSTRNLDKMRELGADRVIDYTAEDFSTQAERYDLILDVNGSRALSDYLRVLRPGGIYTMAGGSTLHMMKVELLGSWLTRFGSKTVCSVPAAVKQEDLLVVKELIEAGKLHPVIDRRFELEQVPDAIRYLEEGHARGKVVIHVQ